MKRHKCLTLVDAELAPHNTMLNVDLFKPNRIFVHTITNNGRRNAKKPKMVVCTFCPFCGKKLPGVD